LHSVSAATRECRILRQDGVEDGIGNLVGHLVRVAFGDRFGGEPGARVQVDLAPDGSGILVRPATATGRKPAAVLFDRATHKGKPVAIDELQGLAAARRLARAGKP
jgi:hypothetical protein